MEKRNNKMLQINDWKRLTVINIRLSKKDLIAQVPFLQPFNFNIIDGEDSGIDIADNILENTQKLFPLSFIAIQETIMFEGQIDVYLKQIYPSKFFICYHWNKEIEGTEYDSDNVDEDDENDDKVIRLHIISNTLNTELFGCRLNLTARLPAGSEETSIPIFINAQYHKDEELEIMRQLKDIEKV